MIRAISHVFVLPVLNLQKCAAEDALTKLLSRFTVRNIVKYFTGSYTAQFVNKLCFSFLNFIAEAMCLIFKVV